MTKIKEIWIIALLVALVQLGLARTGATEVLDRIVAQVNDEIITMSELQDMAKAVQAQAGLQPTGHIDKKMQRQMLQALIDRKLAREEAKRRGIKLSPKELDEALIRFKQHNHIPDDATLAKILANQGLSLKELKQKIADQIIQDRLIAVVVGTKTMVSEAEVRRVYNEKYKKGGVQLHILDLKLPFPPGATDEQKEEIKKKAEGIMQDVKQGVPFLEAAGKLSLSPTDVGFVAQADLDPQLAEFLDKLKPKDVAPVATPAGFQLMQILERRTGEARPYEEVAPEIRRMLTQQDMQKEFSEWVKTLREKAHIKIML